MGDDTCNPADPENWPDAELAKAEFQDRESPLVTEADYIQQVAQYKEALTPSAQTKGAYHGEFKFHVKEYDDEGKEQFREVVVPWTTVKEIMKMILKRATQE